MEQEHENKRNIEEPINLYAFQFLGFAKSNFQGGDGMYQFSRAPLLSPLLSIDHKDDRKAACAISVAILRFMTDMSEAKEPNHNESVEKTSKTKTTKAYSSGTTFKRRIDSEKIQMTGLISSTGVPPLTMMNRPTTNIEKIQFITSFGIHRPNLRDEIYCQIWRQLNNNVSKTSCSRGWILLALCAGVFTPSDTLLNYLRSFMKQGPVPFGEHCYNILQQTLQHECRRQPPTILELEAAKLKSLVALKVTLMDGSTKTLNIYPATTCKDLCHMIKERLGMTNIFGYSIYVAALDQVANWGCGSESVLDAVCLAEQYAGSKGLYDPGVWHLFLRRDLFEPAYHPSDDKVGTDLIYHQILGGIREEEYTCSKSTDLVNMVAKRYYIENGPEMEDGLLYNVIQETLPPFVLQNIEQNQFIEKVKESFNKNSYVNSRSDKQQVKEDIVRYAEANWPREFSRYFDAFVASGPGLPKIAVSVLVNSKGLVVVPQDGNEATRLLELGYSQINQVRSLRKGMYLDAVLVVATSSSHSYSFRSVHADGLNDLLKIMLTAFNNAPGPEA